MAFPTTVDGAPRSPEGALDVLGPANRMKIATLQFDPTFGEVELSIRSADSLLLKAENEGDLQGIELLVLPELAFTGAFNKLQSLCPRLAHAQATTIRRERLSSHIWNQLRAAYPHDGRSEPRLG